MYVSENVNSQSTYELCLLKVCGKCIGINTNLFGARPLYFGAHFTNSPYFDIADEEYEKFERNNWLDKNINTTLEGDELRSKKYINIGVERNMNYGHKRVVRKIAKVGKFGKCKSNA